MEISLIILVSKEKANVANLLCGGNALNIIDKTPHCPVLVVPEIAVVMK